MSFQLKQSISHYINRRFILWLNRRMPSKNKQKLTQRNIFILPSRFGLAFIFLIILLFILGTNYQNNLIIIMCYLFSSLFITTLFYSYFNMAGLSVSAQGTYNGYKDEKVIIPVNVSADHIKQSLTFNFMHHQKLEVSKIYENKTISIPVNFNHRGKHLLNRLIISSEFPLGLFKCWTKLQFDIGIITYPKPLKCTSSFNNINIQEYDELQETKNAHRTKGEDFYELKPYQKGEPLGHVAWKQVAKGNMWQTKHYSQPQNHSILLSLTDMPSNSIEDKLSNLCYLVLKYHEAGMDFGLRLHDNTTNNLIETDSGKNHLEKCLMLLATFNSNQRVHH
jgi:uncharacterized protein (DUF58 family)